MKIKTLSPILFLLLCSCATTPSESNDRVYLPENEIGGFEKWGKGPDPWLTDREKMQREGMKRQQQEEYWRNRKGNR